MACCHAGDGVGKRASFMNARAQPGFAYVPTKPEHIANVVTHGLMIAPTLVGLWWMLHLSVSVQQVLISWVYGLALFTLFSVSTLYHTLAYTGKFRILKDFFHIGDRAVIYLFIAASYTPWLAMKDFGGWSILMLWVVWTCAVLGIIYQYTFHEQYKCLETLLYVGVGVCPAVVVLAAHEHGGIMEVAAGGAVYILGVVAFKCDGRIPFAHAIWHCFVFVGAACHYSAVCKHLLGHRTTDATGGDTLHAQHMTNEDL